MSDRPPREGSSPDSSPEPRADSRADSWPEQELEPTCLVVPLSGGDTPTLTGVLAALRSACEEGLEVIGDGPGDEDLLFEAELRSSESEEAILLQVAPKSYWGSPIRGAAGDSRYALGLRLFLTAGEHPVVEYTRWLRALAHAVPDAPFVYDTAAGSVHPAARLEELRLNGEILLPEEVLWNIHAVRDDRPASPAVWLHTHGLWRCGAPELEMLGVPPEHYRPAGRLLNAVASLLLDEPSPAPGEPLVVADGIVVALQPWRRVVGLLPADMLGGRRDRQEEEGGPHVGLRAVICSPEPQGTLRKRWLWPREAVELIAGDEDTVFRKTAEATLLAARQARATWSEFAMAFFSLGGEDLATREDAEAMFLAKVGFESQDETSDVSHEHVWFRILRIRGDRADGELLNEPVYVSTLRLGQVVPLEKDQLSDWSISTPDGDFGTHQIEALRRYCSERREADGA